MGVIEERYIVLDINAGRGGSGEVIKAHDKKLGVDVAIKKININKKVGRLDRSRITQRDLFEREVKNLAKLNHPNIIRIYDAIEFEGFPAIVTEWVDGGTLEDIVGQCEEAKLLDLGIQISEGLSYSQKELEKNGNPFLHRDIKPDNIYSTIENQIKIGDFGLSSSDEIIPPGSIIYLPPEQIRKLRGEEVDIDPRQDTFSLGVTLYRLATGKFPHINKEFLDETPQLGSLDFYGETLDHVLKREWDSNIRSVNPNFSTGFNNLVRDMLSIDIEDRPYINQVLERLKRIKSSPEIERKRITFLASIVVTFILTGTFIYNSVKPVPPPPLENQVLVVSDQDGDAEIYSVNTERRTAKKLTDNDVDDKNIVPHPLGRRFVFERSDKSQRDLIEMNVNGGEIRRVSDTMFVEEFEFSYSGDGNQGVYLSRYFKNINIMVVDRDENGDWIQRPHSFQGEGITKPRLFIDNTILFMQNSSLRVALNNPGNSSDTIVEDCRDFEVKNNSLYYIKREGLYVRHFSEEEPQLEFFNSHIKEVISESHILYRDLPENATLTLSQDRDALIIQGTGLFRLMDLANNEQIDMGYDKTFLYQDYFNDKLFALIDCDGSNVGGLLSVKGDDIDQLNFRGVLQITNCRIVRESKSK